MALVWIFGAEAQTSSEWVANVGSPTVVTDSTKVIDGGACVKTDSTVQLEQDFVDKPTYTKTTMYYSAKVLFDTINNSARCAVMQARSGATGVATLTIDATTKKLELRNGASAATVLGTSTAALVTGKKYCFQLKVICGTSSNGTLELKIYDIDGATPVLLDTLTGSSISTAAANVTGCGYGPRSINVACYWDSVIEDDAAYPNAATKVIARTAKTGAPTYDSWTKTGTDPYIGNIPFETSNSVTSAALNAQTKLISSFSSTQTPFGTNVIDASATIVGMVMLARGLRSGGSGSTFSLRQRVGAANTDTAITVTTTATIWQGPFSVPSLTNLNAMEAGAVKNTGGGQNMTLYDVLVYAAYIPVAATEVNTQKSLSYKVKAPVASTKQLKYTVNVTPSAITKQLAYAVKTTPAAITKSAQYVVKRSVAPTKPLAYAIKTQVAPSKSLTYAIDATSHITVNKPLRYAVVTATAPTKQLRYAVKAMPLLTKSLKYVTRVTPAAITKSAGYVVKSTSAPTKPLQYRVIFPPIITKALAYAVKKPYPLTKAVTYAVRAATELTKALTYRVKTPQATTKPLGYAVLTQPAALTKPVTYEVITVSTHALTKPLAYAIRLAQALTKGLIYQVKAPQSLGKPMHYTLKSMHGIAKPMHYAVKSTQPATKSLSYLIVKPNSPTKALAYAVQAQVMLTNPLAYRIRQTGTPLTKTLGYRVAQASAVALPLAYIVSQAGTVPKTLRYAVRRPLTLSKTQTYHIRLTAVPSKPLAYQVRAQRPLVRTLAYRLRLTAAPTKPLRYAVRRTPAPTKALTYAIQTVAAPHSLTKPLRYAVTTAPAPAKPLTYRLRQPATVAKPLRYAITARPVRTLPLTYSLAKVGIGITTNPIRQAGRGAYDTGAPLTTMRTRSDTLTTGDKR